MDTLSRVSSGGGTDWLALLSSLSGPPDEPGWRKLAEYWAPTPWYRVCVPLWLVLVVAVLTVTLTVACSRCSCWRCLPRAKVVQEEQLGEWSVGLFDGTTGSASGEWTEHGGARFLARGTSVRRLRRGGGDLA